MNNPKSIKNYFYAWLCLFLAMVLTIIPLPPIADFFRPQWVFIVIIFWALNTHGAIGIGTAWLAGILEDLLTGTLIGQHALVLIILTYLAIKIAMRFRNFPQYLQAIVILIMAALYIFLNQVLKLFMHQTPINHFYELSALSTVLIWVGLNAIFAIDPRAYAIRYHQR